MMPTRRRCAIVLGLGLAVTACASDADTAPELTVQRDTIDGVAYLRHTGPTVVSQLEPLTSVGLVGMAGDEPSPEEFSRIESVIADAAGDMYVADAFTFEIRVFAPDGRFLRRLSRKGQGPGEIEGMHGTAWLRGDTMVVMDYGNARLSLLTAMGEAVGQWPWLRLTGSGRFLFNGGADEVYAHTLARPRSGEERSRSAWVRYTVEGPQDTLDIPTFDPPPGTRAICQGDGIGFFAHPFGDQLLSRPAPARERVLAWSSEYRLAFVDAAGDTVRVVTRDVAPTALADSVWAPVAEDYAEFRASWAGANCEGEITRPQVRPVLEDIVFDHDGRMLVEYLTEAGPAFDLFGLDGVWLATFMSPADRDPSVAPFLRGDRLYLVTKDDLDVQQVRAYRRDSLGG